MLTMQACSLGTLGANCPTNAPRAAGWRYTFKPFGFFNPSANSSGRKIVPAAIPSLRTTSPVPRSSTTCSAASSSAAAAENSPAQLPESREQAVAQACAAIAAQLASSKKVKSRGFSGSGSTKFAVDIPVADSSAAASLALARELVQGLPSLLRSQFTIVAASPAVAAAAGAGAQAGSPSVLALEQCLREGRQLTGCLLVVGASRQQIGDVSRLVANWRGPGAVLLNAEWWADDRLPEEHTAFVGTWEAIYSFVPLDVKAFVTTQQGAVFKWVRSGSPSATPWRIFSLDGKAWTGVGRMQRRPTQGDIENAFYNASAAKSPLTQGAKFFRGLIPGKKDK